MSLLETVEVTPSSLKQVANSFLEQNAVMSRRVTTLSFIIGGLPVGGAFWYIGALDHWIPGDRVTGVEATVADIIQRLGAVVVMIFWRDIRSAPSLRGRARNFHWSRAAALQLLATGSDDKVRLPAQMLVDLVSSDKIQLAVAPESPVAELLATVRTTEKGAARIIDKRD